MTTLPVFCSVSIECALLALRGHQVVCPARAIAAMMATVAVHLHRVYWIV